ncbi:hypothetical protein FKM82_007597 [Ascaphus truei]
MLMLSTEAQVMVVLTLILLSTELLLDVLNVRPSLTLSFELSVSRLSLPLLLLLRLLHRTTSPLSANAPSARDSSISEDMSACIDRVSSCSVVGDDGL